MVRRVIVLVAAVFSLLSCAADAAPLRASLISSGFSAPIADCSAAAPAVGQRFKGAVLQVIDGQTLCVAQGPTPKDWIRVRIAGAGPRSSWEALMAASFGQDMSCLAVKAARLGVEARCSVDGADFAR